jgi:electron transport complex protein RnfB
MAANENETGLPDYRRRRFLVGFGAALAAGGAAFGVRTAAKSEVDTEVWQIDPHLCSACGKCATECVVLPSAVRAVHAYDMCGYCNVCAGFLYAEETEDGKKIQHKDVNSAAENQLCPTDAIERTFVEEPYWEYTFDQDKCIGCAKCVKGCEEYGNGSMFLQVRHDICVNCNECAIARVCPADAFVRVSASDPYIIKDFEGPGEGHTEEGTEV